MSLSIEALDIWLLFVWLFWFILLWIKLRFGWMFIVDFISSIAGPPEFLSAEMESNFCFEKPRWLWAGIMISVSSTCTTSVILEKAKLYLLIDCCWFIAIPERLNCSNYEVLECKRLFYVCLICLDCRFYGWTRFVWGIDSIYDWYFIYYKFLWDSF